VSARNKYCTGHDASCPQEPESKGKKGKIDKKITQITGEGLK